MRKPVHVSTREETSPKIDPRVTARLEAYVAMLDKWSFVTNLISPQAFQRIWSYHVPDGLQLKREYPNAQHWLDIGSGAGLPAAIIAAELADQVDAEVHCVERDGRKCTFLRSVATEVGLPLKVHHVDIESLDPESIGEIDVVTSRAFSSIPLLLRYCDPFLRRGAAAVFPRGQKYSEEIKLIS